MILFYLSYSSVTLKIQTEKATLEQNKKQTTTAERLLKQLPKADATRSSALPRSPAQSPPLPLLLICRWMENLQVTPFSPVLLPLHHCGKKETF